MADPVMKTPNTETSRVCMLLRIVLCWNSVRVIRIQVTNVRLMSFSLRRWLTPVVCDASRYSNEYKPTFPLIIIIIISRKSSWFSISKRSA